MNKGDKNGSGFFDLPKLNICKDPNHNPPQYLYIPSGKGYKHVCPTCGKETIMIPTQYALCSGGYPKELFGDKTHKSVRYTE